MDSRTRGEKLNQLSRLLFDSAANKWYGSVLLEIAVGVLAAVIGILEPPGEWPLFAATGGILLLILAYGLRLWFDDQYDAAETMRRQAALTEGLDWPLESLQASDWRKKAGKRIRNRLNFRPRDPDYYASRSETSPRRLAEMTTESAFYTRHLYDKLRLWIWGLFTGALMVAGVVVALALTRTVPESVDVVVARVLYAVIPVVVSINLLGWALRLSRSIGAIRSVEVDLLRLLGSEELKESQVMRLVSEYDCQLVAGFPIHNRLFKLWQGEIQDLWEQR